MSSYRDTNTIPGIPILLYHRISSGIVPGDRYRMAVSAVMFEKQMGYLYDHGYRCVLLEELLERPAAAEPPRERSFVLTFDDGNEDFLVRAFPVLQRFRFTATVFVVTDLVGKSSSWEERGGSSLMSWNQIRDLQREGITFGSHTCTHRRLTGLPREEARTELLRSRETLAEKLDRGIKFLSYPYGDSNEEIRSIAEEVGYAGACGVLKGEAGRFNLQRREIHSADTLSAFRLKLTSLHRVPNWMRRKTALGRWLDRVFPASKDERP